MDMTGYGPEPAEPIADEAPEIQPEPEPEPAAWPRPEPEPRPALLVGEPFGGAMVLDRDGNVLSSTWTANQATKIVHADGHVWLIAGNKVEARRLDDRRMVASYQNGHDLVAAHGRVFLLAYSPGGGPQTLHVNEPSGELVHSVPIPGDPRLLATGGEVYAVYSDGNQNVHTIRQLDRDGQEIELVTIPHNQTNVFVWRGSLAVRGAGRVTTLDGEIIAERPEYFALFAGDGVEIWHRLIPGTGYQYLFVREGEPMTIQGSINAMTQVDGYTYAIIYNAGTHRLVRLDDMADLGPAVAISAMVPEPLRHHSPR